MTPEAGRSCRVHKAREHLNSCAPQPGALHQVVVARCSSSSGTCPCIASVGWRVPAIQQSGNSNPCQQTLTSSSLTGNGTVDRSDHLSTTSASLIRQEEYHLLIIEACRIALTTRHQQGIPVPCLRADGRELHSSRVPAAGYRQYMSGCGTHQRTSVRSAGPAPQWVRCSSVAENAVAGSSVLSCDLCPGCFALVVIRYKRKLLHTSQMVALSASCALHGFLCRCCRRFWPRA
jgi:hypothetical protein